MRHLVPVVIVLLAGCGPLTASSPYLAIEPEALRLPAAREGAPARAQLRLVNLGGGPLRVRDLRLDPAVGLELQAPSLPHWLEPGDEAVVEVRHRAEVAGSFAGVLLVESDDRLRPRATVPISSLTALPLLRVTPSDIAFGPVASGTTGSRLVALENLGQAAARELALEWEEPCTDFSAALAARELPAGEALDLAVRYTPRQGNSDRAVLRLRWQGGTRRITLEGSQDLRAPD